MRDRTVLIVCLCALAFTACYSWSADDRPLTAILEDEPRHLRLVVDDSLLTLHNPKLRDDVVVGFDELGPVDSVRVENIRGVQSRHFELGKTAAVGGAAVAVPVAGLIVILASGDDGVPLE